MVLAAANYKKLVDLRQKADSLSNFVDKDSENFWISWYSEAWSWNVSYTVPSFRISGPKFLCKAVFKVFQTPPLVVKTFYCPVESRTSSSWFCISVEINPWTYPYVRFYNFLYLFVYYCELDNGLSPVHSSPPSFRVAFCSEFATATRGFMVTMSRVSCLQGLWLANHATISWLV